VGLFVGEGMRRSSGPSFGWRMKVWGASGMAGNWALQRLIVLKKLNADVSSSCTAKGVYTSWLSLGTRSSWLSGADPNRFILDLEC
jgi:hypothetical protein